mgnify:CR=1 FL=1
MEYLINPFNRDLFPYRRDLPVLVAGQVYTS